MPACTSSMPRTSKSFIQPLCSLPDEELHAAIRLEMAAFPPEERIFVMVPGWS